ncbi:MAG TPA: ABC transporter ATP-binding protein [Arenimonas sp.]|nr:ABC transporter ATP-binding protein [Arenimonas sp.]
MSCELIVESVEYRYANGHQALAGVDLRLGPGILGLLGPNGAGKSTLMRILATLSRPSSGRVLWNGVDIAKEPDVLRRELGYLPQDFGVYAALTAREFLAYLAAVKELPSRLAAERVEHCLAEVGLSDAADRRLGGFSGGMRQRVGIAQALLGDPKLLIVDEPTVGLDPEERLRFRHLLTDLAGERLVILSTHIVSDIEASATELAILSQGKLLFDGAPEAFMAQADGRVWEWTVPESEVASARVGRHISSSLRRSDGVRLRVVDDASPAAGATSVPPDLEDAYLYLLSKHGAR